MITEAQPRLLWGYSRPHATRSADNSLPLLLVQNRKHLSHTKPATTLVLAVVPEIGQGFSPDIPTHVEHGASAPGTCVHSTQREKGIICAADDAPIPQNPLNLNAEAGPTPASALHRGILKFEPCGFQRLHIIHRAILQVHRRGSIHKYL